MGLGLPVELEECEEGGYVVTCPILPGCISEGDTKEEALNNIKDAIGLYLRGMAKEVMQEIREEDRGEGDNPERHTF